MIESSLHADIVGDSREEFIARVLASADVPDARLPALPHDELQANFVGLAGREALAQGAAFYRFVRGEANRCGSPLGARSRILDFGVGWGRILRFFAYDAADDGLFGCDVDPGVIAVAQACRVPGNLWAIDPFPPLAAVAAHSLDVVYAFSVFSHLSGAAAGAWIAEFARVLRPGGIAVLTTRNRTFVELCASLRAQTGLGQHMLGISSLFRDSDAALARYDAGELVHEPISGGETRPASFYGETLVSRAYAERAWVQSLALVRFDMDPFPGSYQAALVLQKPR